VLNMKEQDAAGPCQAISAKETESLPISHAELQSGASFSFSLVLSSHFSYTQLLCFPPSFLPFHKTKRNEYSQGYIHCIPYGKVSFVTKLSPLHPGYVITVCASPSPSSTKPTAITDNSCENMVIYTLLFCSLTIFNQMPDPNGV
jgi:hypothetical protein